MDVMVICFDASSDAKNALDELLGSGEFKNISEVISMSLLNYQVIRHAVAEGGGQTLIETGVANHAEDGRKDAEPKVPFAKIPEVFRAVQGDSTGLSLVEPERVRSTGAEAPPKDWLWGQYNRFLPAKATCRALLNLMGKNPAGLPVDDAVAKISYAACGLGDFLNSIDMRLQLSRENAMKAAFPTSDINGGESRLRFGNQFVGTFKQEKLQGFPADLKLVVSEGGKEPKLLLTKAGAAFADLANPVLDTRDEFPRTRLSDEEIAFLLSHIKEYVPQELSAFICVIDGIESGANTPDGLDSYVRTRFNLSEAAMKASFLSTQRTGVVSRMVDLGLLARAKEGLRVTYVTTHPGKYFRSQIA